MMTILRACCALFGFLLTISALPAASHAAYFGTDGEDQNFEIYINGIKAGRYVIQYRHHKKNARTITAQQTYVVGDAEGKPRKVRLIMREYWLGDQFYQLEGKIGDNDLEASFSAKRDKKSQKIAITGVKPEDKSEMEPGAVPFAFWNKDTMASAPLVFEPLTGKPVGMKRATGKPQTVTINGEERRCTGYRVVSSKGLVDVWYDEEERMCAAHMQFEGAIMIFKPEGAAPQSAPQPNAGTAAQ